MPQQVSMSMQQPNPNIVMSTGPGPGMVRPGMMPGQQGGVQVPGQQAGQPMMPGQQAGQPGSRDRDIIWQGELEWQEKQKVKESEQKHVHTVKCSVSTSRDAKTGMFLFISL